MPGSSELVVLIVAVRRRALGKLHFPNPERMRRR